MADKYLLRVTAGSSKDASSHQVVQVNTPHPTHLESDLCSVDLSVHIQNYRGLPKDSPKTSPYFQTAPHIHDQYSISLRLRPKTSIAGPSLLFGNDFDKPIRDRLPPGTSAALRIVKWGIDPGLDGDLYAEQPYLFGGALGSFNVLRVGDIASSPPSTADTDVVKAEDGKPKAGAKENPQEQHPTTTEEVAEEALQEGGDGTGVEWRQERGVPETADARKKWALTPAHAEKWTWEAGRLYEFDFFNPYLDFNDFSLKLPGFSLSVLGYLGGEDFLRYVMKRKDTGEILFVVVFHLLKKEDVLVEEGGTKVQEAGGQDQRQSEDSKEGSGQVTDATERHEGEKSFVPQQDDVD